MQRTQTYAIGRANLSLVRPRSVRENEPSTTENWNFENVNWN